MKVGVLFARNLDEEQIEKYIKPFVRADVKYRLNCRSVRFTEHSKSKSEIVYVIYADAYAGRTLMYDVERVDKVVLCQFRYRDSGDKGFHKIYFGKIDRIVRKVQCPKCRFKSPRSVAVGEIFTCPRCGTKFVVGAL